MRHRHDAPAGSRFAITVVFLASNARGVRLHAEYLAAEMRLRSHHVHQTILVMGSTRASRRHPYYRVAREFGRLVGTDGRAALMTGGGPGIMEAANRGAFEAGGVSIGLNIRLPRQQLPNPYLTPGLRFSFRYFALRKLHFLLRARAMVAFPGGYGTLDELFETLTLVQCRKMKPIPIVLVGSAYWRHAIDFDFLVSEGMIAARDHRLFTIADGAQKAWEAARVGLRRRPPGGRRHPAAAEWFDRPQARPHATRVFR